MKEEFQILIAVSFTLLCQSALAAPVDPNASASTWARIGSSDRAAYSQKVAILCQSRKCGSVEIRACMDEALKPPVPEMAKNMTIGEAAVTCVGFLK